MESYTERSLRKDKVHMRVVKEGDPSTAEPSDADTVPALTSRSDSVEPTSASVLPPDSTAIIDWFTEEVVNTKVRQLYCCQWYSLRLA